MRSLCAFTVALVALIALVSATSASPATLVAPKKKAGLTAWFIPHSHGMKLNFVCSLSAA